MRRITKEKYDIGSMFPDLTSMEEKTSLNWFITYENVIKNLLAKEEITDNDIFTKDNIIDTFIKGASIAHKMLAIRYDNSICDFAELKEIRKSIERYNSGSSKTELE